MSKDKYVIIYRDGYVGAFQCRKGSDFLLETANEDPDFHDGPAYRIRIRQKRPFDWDAYYDGVRHLIRAR